jgi:HAD superfamily hydrolase (TIGR01549 family)
MNFDRIYISRRQTTTYSSCPYQPFDMGHAYDAVVYDLDGTLVRLAVDWVATADRIKPIILAHGGEANANDALDLLPIAEEIGVGEEVDALIAEAEREGAYQSERLQAMDTFLECDVPVGVCSLNSEAACRVALNAHDASAKVDVIVGRDSVAERKPHPEPLLAVVDELCAVPEQTLFVGDSESDAETARRAGTAFHRV